MSLKSRLRDCLNYVHSKVGDDIYNIGIVDHPADLFERKTFPTIKWLEHKYSDRWFADPFIISEDDSTWTILCETYFYQTRRGTIGKIVASKEDFRLLSYKTVLSLDTHLSFPAIIKQGKKIFVYPENSRSGKNTLYLYNSEKESLEPVRVQSNYPLTDAAIFDVEGEQFMISTLSDDPNGNIATIFSIDKVSLWEPIQKIAFKEDIARSAGIPFKQEERLVRPAQICNRGYGEGLCFQEITKTGSILSLNEICRFYANDKKYNIGLHTYNKYKNVAIVDGYYTPSKTLKFLFGKISNLV